MKKLFLAVAILLASLLAAQSDSASDLMKKAEAGDAEAQFQLGQAYDEGKGLPQNDELAVKWYRKSAEQGYANAQNSLGTMYSLARGVPRDKAEALRWYRKAALQSLPAAEFNVAISYYNGDGTNTNVDYAYAWMTIARRHGSPESEQALKQMTDDLHGRNDSAMLFLAQLYEKGDETPRDLKAAFDIYLQLANSSAKWRSGAAELKVCHMYVDGSGVPQDPVEGKSWCKKAAHSGISSAFLYLGRMAENGIGGQKNLKEAEVWYRDGVLSILPEAFMSLGRLKLESGSHDDQRDAYYWFYLGSLYRVPGAEEQAQKVAANLSSNDITKEQKKAVEWRKTPRSQQGRPSYP